MTNAVLTLLCRHDMKLYFGGSFNPVHCGHLQMAEGAVKQFGFDKVVLIPCRQPYHKSVDMLEFWQRQLLVEHAVYQNPLYEVSDVERDMTGNSYTIDVLERLGAFRDGNTVDYLIGGIRHYK
jgi:nicotinate-nucleotide adenylyltransferase